MTQADGSSRPTGGAVSARLVLGGLDEETAFVEYDVDCDADIILGYDWLRAHDLAADGPAFTLPVDAGDPPDFAALAREYADVLADPPPGLPPDRGPAFELRIETGTHPMPRSRPMKRWSQGELDECRKQVAFLLDQGWIVPLCASHAASVVFARKADGTWRFCQD